jgi:hypothetical protein
MYSIAVPLGLPDRGKRAPGRPGLPPPAGQALPCGPAVATQAVTAYEDATSPEWAFGDAAGSRCDLAVARIALGEIDGAREAIAPVLELPAEQRIRGIISSVQHVHTALRRPELPPAGRELQEEIEVFAKTPLRALPA